MPLSHHARKYIESRATLGNVLNRIVIDPEEFDPDRTYYAVTGRWNGEIMESFITDSLYAVNVADWLGELFASVANVWTVQVTEIIDVEASRPPTAIYEASEETFDGFVLPPSNGKKSPTRVAAKRYKITDVRDEVVYSEGTAESVIESLLSNRVKFIDVDGKRLHILVQKY